MPNPTPDTPDRPVLVEHFYRELAADRAAQARRALAAAPFEHAFSQSAAAFEKSARRARARRRLLPADR